MNFKCMLALFVLGLACRSTTAIQCHSCTSVIGLDNTEQTSTTGCADASNLGTLLPEADAVCTTTYMEADSTGTVTIMRGSDPTKLATKTKPYCISEGESTTCYCSTSNCNSDKFAADRSYECYSCESSHYFDNGCGEKLTPGSTHIRTAKGCSACYKIVRVDEDSSVTYKRGCTRSTNIDDECVHEGGNRQCGCKGNLCNSAEGLKSASVVASIVLSVAAKIFSS